MTDKYTPKIMLDGEESRQFSLKCVDCGRRKVVYFISYSLGTLFPAGAYCYLCLVKRCRLSHMIPFPITEDLLNLIKQDLGLKITTPPTRIIGGGRVNLYPDSNKK